MKKIARIFILLVVALASVFPKASYAASYTGAPDTISEAYVVMDAATGQILIEKDMHSKKFPASITKIMTVLLALENAEIDETVTITKSVLTIPYNSSHIALSPGEQLSVEQLLYGTMLPSANDAAIGLAEHVSGSIENFAALMNQKAKEAGALNTNFTNPHGLPDENHYTTPYDMAMIAKYALNVDGFKEVFGENTYVCSPTNIQPEKRYFHTEVQMLNKGTEYYYEYTTGGKFGWTEDSKYTAVVTAEKDGVELICVIMKTTQRYDRMKEIAKLFDYCFDNFHRVYAADDGNDIKVPVYDGADHIGDNYVSINWGVSCLLHNSLSEDNITITTAIPEKSYTTEEFKPTITVSLNGGGYMYGGELAKIDLDYLYEESDRILETDVTTITLVPKEDNTDKPLAFDLIWIIVAVIVVFICLIFAIRTYNIRKYRNIRRKRRSEMYRRMNDN